MDHHLNMLRATAGTTLQAPDPADAVQVSAHRKLGAGKAVTLRAQRLSVLRITHGRVWVTLSDAGPYSRVLAGDHFLSRGQSLTLLPGQELVMESFESSTSSHKATAHFSWETPGVAASALQDAQLAHRAIHANVRQPLRDVRRGLGLVVGACGRLVQWLAHGTATVPLRLLNAFDIFFVANRAGTSCPESSFDMPKKHVIAQAGSCSAH